MANNPKIAFFIADVGLGRGEFYIDLANYLANEIDLHLIAPDGAKFLNRLNPAITVHLYQRWNTRRNPFLLWEIGGLFKRIKPDLVHSHFDMASEIFYRLNKFLKLPHIGTKHNPRKGRIFKKLPNVIAVSGNVASTIDNQHTTTIYNGFSPQEITGDLPERFTMACIGRLEPIKGFDLLLQEIAKLEFDYKLKIIGDGPQDKELAGLIDDLNLADKVTMMGFRTDIGEQLSTSHLQLITSHSEGFNITALEGLAYSPLILSTPVGVAKEFFPEHFLLSHNDIANKIYDIYNNYPEYKNKFCKLKSDLKNKFTLKTCANQHINLYNSILGNEQTD